MKLWTFSTLPAELADTSSWRSVDIDALDEEKRERFIKYREAIEAYLRTGTMKTSSAQVGITRTNLIRQLNRCVSSAADGRPYGWAALIQNLRTKDYQRVADIAPGMASKGSTAGAFQMFMEQHPEIKDKISNLFLKCSGKAHIDESRISMKDLHAAFVILCEQAGILGNMYPLNSKSRGRRSIERYAQQLIVSQIEAATSARFGKTAKSHLSVGRGRPSGLIAYAPYDLVGIDPHKIDCIGTVRINGPKGPQRVAIERLWITPVLDDNSRAILGYSVGIRSECSAATIEQAIISAMSTWQPRKLIVPGMTYARDSGLPSGVIPELSGRAWVAMMVDNAAVHYSHAISERARRRLGCGINYGAIGHWEHRAALERVMKTLETLGFQRLPSTTGSGPTDPRKDNPVKCAVELGIGWEELLDVIDVVVADYNAKPNEALGNRSPLSLLRDYVSIKSLGLLPRRLPPPTATLPDLGIQVEIRTVRGDPDNGRRPYIEIDRVHYTSPILSSAFALIGRKMRMHIRASDMCTVRAFHESGEELGVLTAQGAWGRTKHTREMRKEINALRDSGQIEIRYNDNPFVVLLQHLETETAKDATRRPLKVSRSATRLARARAETGLTTAHAPAAPPSPKPETSLSPVAAESPAQPLIVLVQSPKWKTLVR
ncbi:MAG: hypothetical protein V4508_12900 [Pseudomonadota bacterium]